MIKRFLRASRSLIRYLMSSLLGAIILIVVYGVVELNSRPDLSVWHKTVLDQEFSASLGLKNFTQYLELEERLFDQLDQQIYQKIEPQDQRAIIRYNRGSLSDPERWPRNWNRSFVLPVDDPTTGVLLLHGMSDSPYSLRSIGQLLHGRGAFVIGLRVPGHGQAPSGLVNVEWQDMAAAVRLAISALREKTGDRPIYIVGYSNGGALAVQYALDSLGDSGLTPLDGLVLLSPEIGVSKLAAMAKWQERLGRLLGLEKLGWNALLPEYDPWKYGSFALNAGKQAYLITQEIQKQLGTAEKAGTLDRMPPVLAFQSVVDATVTAPALVDNFFDRLPVIEPKASGGQKNTHELVLFDFNRYAEIEPIMKKNPSAWIDPIMIGTSRKFMLTLLSNEDRSDQHLVAATTMPGSSESELCDTGLSWPDNVYSLSHVALPFPPDDPVYGGDEALPSPGISLGRITLLGERNVLEVSAADMMRLRYNPFHGYMVQRLLAFMGFPNDPDSPPLFKRACW